MKLFAALALLALPSALLAAPVPKEVKKEKTEGTWQMESLTAFGRPVNLGAGGLHWTIDADGNMKSHNGPVVLEAARSFIRLAFDPESKTVEYKNVSANAKGSSSPGVYELAGDSLKICCNIKGTAIRPTTVDGGPDVYLWTFKRVKPEAKK